MTTEVRFPVDPESGKPFLPELYIRRTDEGYEIGLSNRRRDDYAWAMISKDKLEAALALLNMKDKV